MGTSGQSEMTPLDGVFPDERTMERSADGSEPIRGGSVGFNRILGTFVERSKKDTEPFADLFLINGMTVFRNIYQEDLTDTQLTQRWEHDLDLFSQYLGIYRVIQSGGNDPATPTQVVVYLPIYDMVPKEVRLSHSGTKLETFLLRWRKFYTAYKRNLGVLVDSPGVRMVCIAVGERNLPHREVDKYLFTDPIFQKARMSKKIVMITHVIMDYFICIRLPSIVVWESYTAKFKRKDEFGLRLDPSGDIPFNSLMFNLFGDKLFVRSVLDIKGKRFVRETAKRERFPMHSQTFMEKQLSALSNVPIALLARVSYA